MKNATLGIAIGAALIVCTWLFTHSWDKRINSRHTIDVVGLAKVDFTSDLIVWRGSFSRKAINMKEAYSALKADENVIKSYLKSKGIQPESFVISSVQINQEYDYKYDQFGHSNRVFTGYLLTQEIKIESNDVAKIESLSREVTELIDQGVAFYSNPPQYYYTQLSDLKIEMIATATQDARLRAEQIAENAGAEVGKLLSANAGVFQITGQNSNEEFTWGGVYNTHEKNKTARVTMRLNFEIE